MSDYERIERAILFVQAQARRQPTLAEVAGHVGLSPHHLQRVFRRWAGLSPKRFLQFLTLESAKTLLLESRPVLETAYDVGLSGAGRLHDLFVTAEAVTPGEYKLRGAGLTITHGLHETPFGTCLLGLTPRGVCALSFHDRASGGPAHRAVEALAGNWPAARLRHAPGETGAVVRSIFATGDGNGPGPSLLLCGTNFQIKVWSALLAIPPGAATSYGALASGLGRPGAARSVASAVASNRIAYLIPCHRVLRNTGAIGGYRWGIARKSALLLRETSEKKEAAGRSRGLL